MSSRANNSPSLPDTTRLTRKELEEKSNLLCAAKRSGLDSANSLHIVNRYLTSYCCKGGQSSGNWRESSQCVMDEYVNRDGNENKTMMSIVSKIMLEVSRALSLPRDQALFQCGGGMLKRSTAGRVYKASVSSVRIDDLANSVTTGPDVSGIIDKAEAAEIQKSKKSFTLQNIIRRYRQRGQENASMSLYEFCIFCWKDGHEVVPMFFGYNKIPQWPMNEVFSFWNLVLHKPWMEHPKEVMNGSAHMSDSVNALVTYLLDEGCRLPDTVWNEILRVKRKENAVVVDNTSAVSGNAGVLSPSNNRTDIRLAEVADAADVAISQAGQWAEYEDYDESMIGCLRKPPVDHDWSVGYEEADCTSLKLYCDAFYEQMTADELNDEEGSLTLFDEELYRPENAKTDEQRFLIYHHLYHQWLKHHNDERADVTTNDCSRKTQFVWVEGLPGMCKHLYYLFCEINITIDLTSYSMQEKERHW